MRNLRQPCWLWFPGLEKLGQAEIVKWNRIFRLFWFSIILREPHKVHPKFWEEVPFLEYFVPKIYSNRCNTGNPQFSDHHVWLSSFFILRHTTKCMHWVNPSFCFALKWTYPPIFFSLNESTYCLNQFGEIIFEFGWILNFLWLAKNAKIAINVRHFVSRPSSERNGSSGSCDVYPGTKRVSLVFISL